MIASSKIKSTETVAARSGFEQVRLPAENRILLHNISWETFERLLADVGDRALLCFLKVMI
jgi:hypothetical protein